MKLRHGILAAVALSVSTAASASIELGCVRVELDRARSVCSGGLAPLDVAVDNSCTDNKRVALTFSLDREPLRAQAASSVPAEEQVRKSVMVEIPGSIAAGTHTLTMTARDIEGNANTTSMLVIVERCATVGL